MATGYVKLYRSSLNDPLYMKEPFTKWQAWCDLILSAYFAPADFFVRGIKVKAKRGCVYIGVLELAERWRWSRGKVERFLKYLVSDKRVSIQKNNIVNCITILNYERYQQNEPSSDNDAAQSDSNPHDELLIQLMEQINDIRDRLDGQDAPPKASKKKEVNPLITGGRKVFEKVYLDLFGSSYYWQAKDAVAMGALTKKIIYARTQNGFSTVEGDVLSALESLLHSISDEWMLKNFSVTNINSKYNEIVAQARAKIKNGKQDKSDHSDKRRGSEVTATEAKDYEGTF